MKQELVRMELIQHKHQPIVLKRNDHIQYRINESDDWSQAVILSRGGKVTGNQQFQDFYYFSSSYSSFLKSPFEKLFTKNCWPYRSIHVLIILAHRYINTIKVITLTVNFAIFLNSLLRIEVNKYR